MSSQNPQGTSSNPVSQSPRTWDTVGMRAIALRGLSSVASGLVRRQSTWPLHLHMRNAITLRRNFCARAIAAHALDDASSEKLGSASPWATDGWGDSVEIIEQTMPDAHRALLSNASVAIPTSSAEAGELPAVSDILGAYEAQLQRRTARHLGYPYNLDYQNRELDRFMRYSINNLGDPFVPSNYGVHSRQFEVAVVDFFARLWRADPNDYWGYVTTCGTEGNLYGMLLARETLPDGIVYTSSETHYSVFKAAHYYRQEVEVIPQIASNCLRVPRIASDWL